MQVEWPTDAFAPIHTMSLRVHSRRGRGNLAPTENPQQGRCFPVLPEQRLAASADGRFPLFEEHSVAKRSLLPDAVERYVAQAATRETPLQQRLRAETALLPEANMQIGPDQAALTRVQHLRGQIR